MTGLYRPGRLRARHTEGSMGRQWGFLTRERGRVAGASGAMVLFQRLRSLLGFDAVQGPGEALGRVHLHSTGLPLKASEVERRHEVDFIRLVMEVVILVRNSIGGHLVVVVAHLGVRK